MGKKALAIWNDKNFFKSREIGFQGGQKNLKYVFQERIILKISC